MIRVTVHNQGKMKDHHFRCMRVVDGPSNGTGLVMATQTDTHEGYCHASFAVNGDWWSARYENFGRGCSMLHLGPYGYYKYICIPGLTF